MLAVSRAEKAPREKENYLDLQWKPFGEMYRTRDTSPNTLSFAHVGYSANGQNYTSVNPASQFLFADSGSSSPIIRFFDPRRTPGNWKTALRLSIEAHPIDLPAVFPKGIAARSSALFDRYELPAWPTFVNLPRTTDLLLRVVHHFHPVRHPSHRTTDGKHNGEHLIRYPEGAVDNT